MIPLTKLSILNLPNVNTEKAIKPTFQLTLHDNSERSKNDLMYKKLRPREHVSVTKVRNSRSPSVKKTDIVNGFSKSSKIDRKSNSPFEVFFILFFNYFIKILFVNEFLSLKFIFKVETPIVVGDYRNPFDFENLNSTQQKMRSKDSFFF